MSESVLFNFVKTSLSPLYPAGYVPEAGPPYAIYRLMKARRPNHSLGHGGNVTKTFSFQLYDTDVAALRARAESLRMILATHQPTAGIIHARLEDEEEDSELLDLGNATLQVYRKTVEYDVIFSEALP